MLWVTNSKLFVGGLSFKTTDRLSFAVFVENIDSLGKYFSKFGAVKQANVMKYTDRQVSRGFGFCIFEDPQSAELAMQTKVHMIDGRKVLFYGSDSRNRSMYAGLSPRKWPLLHSPQVGGHPSGLIVGEQQTKPITRKVFVGGLSTDTTNSCVSLFF